MQYYKESGSVASGRTTGNNTLTQSIYGQSATNRLKGRQFVDDRKTFFFLKRAFDVFVALMVVVFVLSWLFPVIAIMIKLESSGPLFFLQKRVGKGGRTFLCFKFRTMIVNESAHLHQATCDDIRITRVGNFLRYSNLDEFPQFLNVLIGDMSIVGPRPHMHADCSRFSSMVPGYKFRNMVKPGITGLAQVKGYRGPTRNFNCVFHRFQFDAFYIRNANFGLDMRIVRETAFQTFVALIGKLTPKSESRPFMQRKWVLVIRSLIN